MSIASLARIYDSKEQHIKKALGWQGYFKDSVVFTLNSVLGPWAEKPHFRTYLQGEGVLSVISMMIQQRDRSLDSEGFLKCQMML